MNMTTAWPTQRRSGQDPWMLGEIMKFGSLCLDLTCPSGTWRLVTDSTAAARKQVSGELCCILCPTNTPQ